jgi:hypothetical protein
MVVLPDEIMKATKTGMEILLKLYFFLKKKQNAPSRGLCHMRVRM